MITIRYFSFGFLFPLPLAFHSPLLRDTEFGSIAFKSGPVHVHVTLPSSFLLPSAKSAIPSLRIPN